MESENDVGKEKKSDGWCEKVQDQCDLFIEEFDW